ncbi:Transcriptional activator hac1 [Neonectria ditissima]|uniref:Transcriptional activator hac1 n=1 Tax=Neonectria ditissima TaxID=78410 RepID=A0A0P7BCL9_9HYPO|nr:Transcriptional activator hac1 [Neonectria ditissima]
MDSSPYLAPIPRPSLGLRLPSGPQSDAGPEHAEPPFWIPQTAALSPVALWGGTFLARPGPGPGCGGCVALAPQLWEIPIACQRPSLRAVLPSSASTNSTPSEATQLRPRPLAVSHSALTPQRPAGSRGSMYRWPLNVREGAQTSPMVKFENSPAESFISTPGDTYTSLFAAGTPSATNTMNPMEMMTPKSFTEEKPTSAALSAMDDLSDEEDDSPAPSGEKKSAKKRKSWGQVLPEPKTNLPPRKRAKTEDEKEQRRVERVLRNRRAAQSSRERKRLEVEALEKRNKELESMLINAQKANLLLVEELNRFRRSSGVVTRSSSPLDSLRDNPVTLSQELFSSQDGHKPNAESSNPVMDDILISAATVNPASLSPELGPVDDSSEDVPEQPSKEAQTMSIVGGDAQVVPGLANLDGASLGLSIAASDDVAFSLGDSFSMSTAIDADRYVLESGLLSSPNSSIIDDDYLVGDSAAGFTHQSDFDLFDINDFLIDEANPGASDFMAASDFAAADHDLDFKVHDSETQVSSENPIQQPQPGASALGCDAGGIAVGV